MLVQMSPGTKDEQQWNPPCTGLPEEQSKSFYERQDRVEQTPRWRSYDQPCSGESCNGNSSHINPIRWSERYSGEVDESETIKDECDKDQIEHTAE